MTTFRAVEWTTAAYRALQWQFANCGQEVPMETVSVFIGSDTPFEVQALTDKLTGLVVSAAVVTANFTDKLTGVPIPGIINPVTLAPVAGQPGNYRFLIPDTATLTPGQRVLIETLVDAGGGLKGRREVLGVVEE